MKKVRIPVRILAAGAAVSVSFTGCPRPDPEIISNPPEMGETEAPTAEVSAGAQAGEPATGEPPVVDMPMNPPPMPSEASELPSWDEVKSGHPEGATNPPSPFLRVTPDGECYKFFRGMMAPPRPGEVIGDRVEDCPAEGDCGTRIQCPEPRASELLDAFQSGEASSSKPVPTKPSGGL